MRLLRFALDTVRCPEPFWLRAVQGFARITIQKSQESILFTVIARSPAIAGRRACALKRHGAQA